MSNFWKRAVTGTVFVIVLLGAVLWGRYSFLALCFAICVLGVHEYATLFKGKKNKPDFLGTVIGGVLVTLVWTFHFLYPEHPIFEWNHFILLTACLLIIPVLSEFVFNKTPSVKNIGLSLAGIAYINLGIFCFASIGYFGNNGTGIIYSSNIIMAFLILQWSSDTFAYLVGRSIGKTPLAPKISPKKTWEGSIGGAVCTIGVSYILYRNIGDINMAEWMGFALIVVVFGTLGDLIESRFKRVLGVKDSGNILPGHGGILDRFDSLLFAAPFVFVFLMTVEGIN